MNIGIVAVGSSQWLGGIFYVEHLLRALSALPDGVRPEITLAFKDDVLERNGLHAESIRLANRIVYVGSHQSKAREILGPACLVVSDLLELLEHVDVLFPINSNALSNPRAISWIPDFQHRHLPKFFSPSELTERDRLFAKVAFESRFLVLSSETAMADFRRFYPDATAEASVLRFHATPSLQVTEEVDSASLLARHGLPEKFLICCNQFWAHKNHVQLFEALAHLRDIGQSVHLVCTGATSDYRWPGFFAEIRKMLATLGIQEQVHLLGTIPRTDQLQLIRHAMAVVQPSLFEGWSTVIEDVRAIGTPLLLSDTQIHREQAPIGSRFFAIGNKRSLPQLFEDILPTLRPGPDPERESRAAKECSLRAEIFARDFVILAQRVSIATAEKNQPAMNYAAPDRTCLPDIEVATSIAPFGIPAQKAAIETWLDLGCQVVSVNSAEEIAPLKPHFPRVRFVEARRTGMKLTGKPYVFIDDLMAALRDGGAAIGAIINSDVILRMTRRQLATIATTAPGGLVYGSRCEIPSADTPDGPLYRRGFDYFFFDRALIDHLPATDYMLGVPWWDYWVPWAAITAGLPTWRYDAHVAYHVSHPVNYSVELITAFGQRFLQKAATPFMRRTADTISQRLPRMHFGYVLADQVVSELSRRSRRLDPPPPPPRPQVTAIVSTYASGKFIADCLDDLVGQTIADRIEVVVIDAASPENEGEIVRRYQEKHPNIRYHRTAERIGVYAAWNLAARMARGDYLISCSTNDRLRPDALEILAATLDERPPIALAYGNSYLTTRPHEHFGEFTLHGAYVWGPATVHELLKAPNVGPHPMWRRTLHDEIGHFDESMKAIGDQDFWLRIAARHPLERIEDFTGLYYVDDQSLSGDRTTASSEIRLVHERHARRYFYDFWQQDHRLSKAHAEHYDRQLAVRGQATRFALCLVHEDTDTAPLIATIQDLAGNYYPEAFILVLSRLPAPAGLAGGRIEWCQAETPSLALGWQILADGGVDQPADWILGLTAGDQLAPHALLSLNEAIATHAEWRLIYADEDTLDENGSRSQPRFRPGPDLTLLREAPYLGEVLAVSLATLREFAPDGFHNSPAAGYDLALRIAEDKGIGALGHLSDVLWHRPAREPAAHAKEAVLDALLHHLRRTVPAAELVPGLFPGSVRVRYPLSQPPLLHVLAICPDDRAAVESFLAAFLEQNSYAEWRMTLVAPAAGRSLGEYLAAVAGLGDPRLKVAPAGMTARRLVLDRSIDEELVLFLDASARPAHPGWIEAMAEHVQRPGIAAAGARLTFANGQLASAAPVFGFLGLQGSPYRGFPVGHSGDQNLLCHSQERTVLDPACVLARREAILLALSETDDLFDDRAALVDACLRLRQSGQAVVWTPYSTLVVTGSALMQETEDIHQVDDAPTPTDDEDRVFRRWLAVFPEDPAHNPNISRVRRGYKVEPDAALNWRPLPWRPIPRCVGYVADFAGCGYYRAIDPMDALARAGRIEGYVGSRGYIPAEIAQAQADTFIFQRQYKDEQIRLIEHHRRYSNALRVYELDDLITRLPKQSAFREGIPKDIDSRLKKALSLCDRLVVSTDPLAKAYGGYANETVVVPNYLPGWKWTHLTPPRQKSAKPRVGWAGALGHTGDLALIVEIVEALRDTVEWVFMGDIHPAVKSIVRERHPFVPIDQYPAALASLDLDIALAPLESNSFNEAKSHLKLLEYGVLGYPVICSDITPYQGKFPVTRLNNVSKKWIATIKDKISDREALKAEGEQLKQYVLDNWLLENNGDVWLNAWTRELSN